MRSQSTSLDRICSICGASFTVRSSIVCAGGGKYCSRACRDIAAQGDAVGRFWSRIDCSGGPDACWPWISSVGGDQRRVRFNGRVRSVRQIAWELGTGVTLTGQVNVKVLCGTAECCNPSHLEYFSQDDPARFWKNVDKADNPDGCWLWTGKLNSHGYGLYYINGKTVSAHRTAYRLAHSDVPEGLCVCHICDVRHCVNPEHLWLGTNDENMHDMAEKGRASHQRPLNPVRGEDMHSSILTNAAVIAIRKRRAEGERGIDLAREFDVCPETISNVVRRKTWKHLP